MKYFGILRLDTIENFNTEEMVNFLVDNQLFEKFNAKEYYSSDDIDSDNFDNTKQFIKSTHLFFLTLNEFLKLVAIHLRENINQKLDKEKATQKDFNNFLISQDQNISIQPTQNLLDDFYQSFIEFHNEKITKIKFTFYLEYGEKIFGLNFNDQKTIALKNYKKIYKIIFKDKIIYAPDLDLDEELDNYENYKLKVENKLNLVYYHQQNYMHKLADLNPFFAYITGNEAIFTKTYYNKNQKTIDEALKYEALKEIMVELNTKFKFEEDFYNMPKEEKIYTDASLVNTIEVEFKNKKNNIKPSTSEKNPSPFIDFIRHENKTEIERRIKNHYSDLRGVSLRYLIEFLKEEGVLFLNHGDAMKFYKSIKILFGEKNIGAYTSIFDSKVFSITDQKYLNSKSSFIKTFKDIL